MQIYFDKSIAKHYKSASQKIRVLSESWVSNEIFCPNCGRFISQFKNSRPVADFFCQNCGEEYELKSKKNSIGSKVVNGAYRTMIERLKSTNNPNFFLLNYNPEDFSVINFLVIPKHFFIPDIIEKRRALSPTAKRAGWVGCNILLKSIPHSGKIFFVRNGQIATKRDIVLNWQKTLFLREEKEINTKGWLLDIMNCIENLGNTSFSLSEIYAFKNILREKHPQNMHIKDKIRQQLQVLRDKGYLEFVSRGNYRLK